jgi:hypothetical protein
MKFKLPGSREQKVGWARAILRVGGRATRVIQERRQLVRQVISPRLYVPLNGASSGGILSDVSEGNSIGSQVTG